MNFFFFKGIIFEILLLIIRSEPFNFSCKKIFHIGDTPTKIVIYSN